MKFATAVLIAVTAVSAKRINVRPTTPVEDTVLPGDLTTEEKQKFLQFTAKQGKNYKNSREFNLRGK